MTELDLTWTLSRWTLANARWHGSSTLRGTEEDLVESISYAFFVGDGSGCGLDDEEEGLAMDLKYELADGHGIEERDASVSVSVSVSSQPGFESDAGLPERLKTLTETRPPSSWEGK